MSVRRVTRPSGQSSLSKKEIIERHSGVPASELSTVMEWFLSPRHSAHRKVAAAQVAGALCGQTFCEPLQIGSGVRTRLKTVCETEQLQSQPRARIIEGGPQWGEYAPGIQISLYSPRGNLPFEIRTTEAHAPDHVGNTLKFPEKTHDHGQKTRSKAWDSVLFDDCIGRFCTSRNSR
jgi:hypothetical protein